MADKRELPILYVVLAGSSDEFPRFTILDAQDRPWNGQEFGPTGVLYACWRRSESAAPGGAKVQRGWGNKSPAVWRRAVGRGQLFLGFKSAINCGNLIGFGGVWRLADGSCPREFRGCGSDA